MPLLLSVSSHVAKDASAGISFRECNSKKALSGAVDFLKVQLRNCNYEIIEYPSFVAHSYKSLHVQYSVWRKITSLVSVLYHAFLDLNSGGKLFDVHVGKQNETMDL
jgi:hypothetical protein